jgi:hypothetical protein
MSEQYCANSDDELSVRFAPIALKKSLVADERNFSARLVRPARGNVRDHIDSHKCDHRASYLPYRGAQRRRQLKNDLRETFGAAQFSTFSAISARNGPDRLVWRCPLIGVDRKWLVDGQNDAIDPYRKSRLSTMEAQSRRNILNGKHLYRAGSLSHIPAVPLITRALEG